ncbi:MAG TPA: DUF2813 domain-containing protein, partial [Candidatus Atribacteria bacterium]|nr:DUF2813 domain-containing protein [Candidatus Atribacteria bacterium]
LENLNQTIDKRTSIQITPLTKKVRDLNKGLTIYYGENEDNSLSMEYHGMGARSWSSILSFKTFLDILYEKAQKENKLFFPIIAIEEPETHLHPNAQKQLYNQLKTLPGFKIITTHSPYIVASSNLNDIVTIYKNSGEVVCGNLKELSEDEKKRFNIRLFKQEEN